MRFIADDYIYVY